MRRCFLALELLSELGPLIHESGIVLGQRLALGIQDVDDLLLDDDLLLIRQNSPGGDFAAVRVDAAELDASPV